MKTISHLLKQYNYLLKFILKTSILIAIVLFFIIYVFKIYRMDGNTMSPFVRDGDLCVFYCLSDYCIGDVVLYEYNGENQVGRIVAMGQTVKFLENGGYEIDGYRPTEEIPYETYSEYTEPIALDENECFILNDFRSLTNDSREIGPIHKKKIKGSLLILLRRRGF